MLIANMAMSDLLFPTFLFPLRLAEVHVGSWIIGGALGQALCKLHVFLANTSMLVSIQSLVLIAVDRFGAVVVPLRSPLITRKLCPFFIIATWIVAMAFHSPDIVAFKLVKYPERLMCKDLWQEAFGGSMYPNYLLAGVTVFVYIPFVLLVILYSIILIKLKKQAHPGEKSATAEGKRTRRNRNVFKMTVAIVVVFFICYIPCLSIMIILGFSAPDSPIFSSCSFYPYAEVTLFWLTQTVLLTRLSASLLAVTTAKVLRDLCVAVPPMQWNIMFKD